MKKAGLFMVGIVRAAVLSFGMTMVKPSTTHTNPVNYSRIYRSRGQCKIARTKMNRYTAVILGFSPLVVASFGRGSFLFPPVLIRFSKR